MSQPDSAVLAYYGKHAADFCNSTAHLKLHKLYEPFLKELRPDSNILDAGCGSGRDTKAFLNKGYRVTGIDASPQMARMATKFSGQHCRVLSFQEMSFREEFDGIWACASLLLVPHKELGAILRRFATALKPRGVFYLSMKEGHGQRMTKDGLLLIYYGLKEFRSVLERNSLFETVRAWKSKAPDSSGQLQGWLNFLVRKTG